MPSGVQEEMKRLISFISLVAVLFALIPQGQAATKIDLNAPDQGLNINESFKYVSTPPAMFGVTGDSSDPRYSFCSSIEDNPCIEVPGIMLNAHLSACDSTVTINCISSVYAKSESGQVVEGTFIRYAAQNTKWSFEQQVKNNLPQVRGQGGIWKIAGLNHGGGGDSYFVDALTTAWLAKTAGQAVSNQVFSITSLDATVTPINEVAGNYSTSIASDSANRSSDGSISGGMGAMVNQDQASEGCIMMEDRLCMRMQDYPAGYRFGIKIRLGNNLNGWFHGRIYRPEVTVITNAAGGQDISIEALPVLVPTVTIKIPTSTITPELRTYLSQDKRFSNGSGYLMPGNAGQDAIDQVALWLPIIKDTASSSRLYWDVKTLIMDDTLDPTVRTCSTQSSSVAGIVTTNALAYSAGPPTFNKSEASLDYKVVSPHLTSKNEVAIGTYDLALRSDVARCIYGFSKAPISGSISIINESGTSTIATTVVNERNGWLFLSANGFTYSSPTLKVKLEQSPEPAPVIAPPPTPAPSKAATTKKFITCTKGKVKKILSGTNPKCPAGFKKVA